MDPSVEGSAKANGLLPKMPMLQTVLTGLSTAAIASAVPQLISLNSSIAKIEAQLDSLNRKNVQIRQDIQRNEKQIDELQRRVYGRKYEGGKQ